MGGGPAGAAQNVRGAGGRGVVGGAVVLAVGVVQVHAREDVVVAGELAVEGVEVQVQQVGAEARRRAVQVRGAVEVGIGEAGQVLLRHVGGEGVDRPVALVDHVDGDGIGGVVAEIGRAHD